MSLEPRPDLRGLLCNWRTRPPAALHWGRGVFPQPAGPTRAAGGGVVCVRLEFMDPRRKCESAPEGGGGAAPRVPARGCPGWASRLESVPARPRLRGTRDQRLPALEELPLHVGRPARPKSQQCGGGGPSAPGTLGRHSEAFSRETQGLNNGKLAGPEPSPFKLPPGMRLQVTPPGCARSPPRPLPRGGCGRSTRRKLRAGRDTPPQKP